MENIFYLFPVAKGLLDSYAHPLLQREAFSAKSTFVFGMLSEVFKLDADLQRTSLNKRSYYFSENVQEFCSGIVETDYPTKMTLIRLNFGKRMSDASSIIPNAGECCLVYDSPVSGKDYFVRALLCNLSGKAVGSVLFVLPASGKRSIRVQVGEDIFDLDACGADFLVIADWIAKHHDPPRVFENNPKHDYEHYVKGGNIAGKWPYDVETSQSFLNRALVNGERLVFKDPENGVVILFDQHEPDCFHAHIDNIDKVDNEVQKLLRRFE